MLPGNITGKIKGLQGLLKLVAFGEGVARILGYFAVCIIVTFLVDYITPMPAAARVVVNLGVLAGAVYLLARCVINPLAGVTAEDRLALMVEHSHPELRDALISAVQLSRALENPAEADFHSPELIEKVIADTSARVKSMNFGDAIKVRRLLASWLVAIVLFAGITLFAANFSDKMGIYFGRFLALSGEWPKNNNITLQPAPPERIAKGDDLDVVFTSTKDFDVPGDVYIYSRPTDMPGAGWEFSNTKKYVGGIFKYTFHNAIESFEFYAVGGDCVTRPFQIEVTERPRVDEILLSFDYPKYLLESGYGGPATLMSGNAKVPAGTLVTFNVVTNKPVKRAELVGVKNLEGPNVFEGGAVRESGEVSSVRGKFNLEKTASYHFKFVDTYGFDSGENPIKYTITAVPDKAPKVKIVEPNSNRDYTVEAEVPVKITLQDDHAIKELQFRYCVLAGGLPEKDPDVQVIVLKELEVGTKELEHEFVFNIKNLARDKNDVIVYWAAAKDFRPDDESAWGESEPRYRITLISRQDAPPIIKDMLRRITEELKKTRMRQALCRGSLHAAVADLEKNGYTKDVNRELGSERSLQGKITNRLKDIVKMVENLIRFKESNKLMDERDKTWLPEIREAIKTLALEKSPRVVEYIGTAREIAKKQGSGEAMKLAWALQGEILAELDRLIKELQNLEDIQEVITRALIIKGMQERILDALIEINTGKKKRDK